MQGTPITTQVPRLLNREYEAAVFDLLGVETPSGLNEDYDGPMNPYAWTGYLNVGAAIAADVISGPEKANFISCDPDADAACWESTIRSFGRKAFRRPLKDEEVAGFMGLTSITPQGTNDEIAEAILYGFLVAPSFIMAPEMEPDAVGAEFKLNNYEVAMRLSLMLWGSVPDDALNAAADAGELSTKEGILAQAQRMLGEVDKAGAQVGNAHRAFTGANNSGSHWFKISHDTSIYDNYSDAAVPALEAEMDAFFSDIVMNGGTFDDFFLSNVGFVNEDSAPIYNLNSADFGPELTKVVHPPERPGFLTRAGFLTSFSNYEATSPILRGAFITVNIIGVDPGPPIDAPPTKPPAGDYATRRQEIDALTAPASCDGCHGRFINPPGYALENFDAVGSWQTNDVNLGGEIDASADIAFTADDPPVRVTTPLELMQGIVANPKSKRIYTERIVSFSLGRLPNSQDACVVDELSNKLTAGGYTILNLLTDLTQADSFGLRKAAL
jgi:hypothetical protein